MARATALAAGMALAALIAVPASASAKLRPIRCAGSTFVR